MKAGVIFTGSGPILILTTYASLTDVRLAAKLEAKGIRKYLGYELPLEQVKRMYGAHYQAIVNDVKQSNDLRVLDYNGHNVFYNFHFSDLGAPMVNEM